MDPAGMSDVIKIEIDMAEEPVLYNSRVESAALGHEDEGHHDDHTDRVTHTSCHQINLADPVTTCTTETDRLHVTQETVSVPQGGVLGYYVSVDSETNPLPNIKQEPDAAVAWVLPVPGVGVGCGIEPDPGIKQELETGFSPGIQGPGGESESCVELEPSETSPPQLSGPSTPAETHTSRSKGEKPFYCADCGLSFPHFSRLKEHRRTHTKEKPFKCSECGASFSYSGSVKRHMRTHTGERRFKCTECGQAFRECIQLKYHMRTHTGEKPFKCTECGDSFSWPSQLKLHMYRHTGEKPCKCEDCGASFCQPCRLEEHRRTHTGERPYMCRVCGDCFFSANHLRAHVRIHTGVRSFKCSKCKASFSRAGSLKRHMCRHTGE